MVHEAMVLEYSGRHLAMIDPRRFVEAAALYFRHRLHLLPHSVSLEGYLVGLLLLPGET